MIALGYVRRSKKSDKRTASIEDQRERISDYCREHGWDLADIVIDDGVSGGRRERLERLNSRLRATKAGAVVVYHLDRLARDAAALLDWLEGAAKRRVELHVVGRGKIETQTASGYLMAGVEGVVAAHYRKVISEKTRDALARLRANGRRTSRWAPYGFDFDDAGGLVERADERAALAAIARLHAAGRSLRAVAAALAARGILARNGRRFAPSTLQQLVRNRPVTDSAGR